MRLVPFDMNSLLVVVVLRILLDNHFVVPGMLYYNRPMSGLFDHHRPVPRLFDYYGSMSRLLDHYRPMNRTFHDYFPLGRTIHHYNIMPPFLASCKAHQPCQQNNR